MAPIVVIGAGVIGLQTANTLLDAGHEVLILAKHWPGDMSIEYTSPWAGAIWRTHATRDDVDQCKWNIESYKYWMEVIEQRPKDAEEMGMQRVPITIFSNEPDCDPNRPHLWFAVHVQDFCQIPTLSLPPNGPQSGYAFASVAINPSKYLDYLLARAKRLGARTITAELPTSQGLAHALSVAMERIRLESEGGGEVMVVNCTGLGASALCHDMEMYPVRGQTLLVRIVPPPKDTRIVLYDSTPATYMVPRIGTDMYLLGGTNDAHSWEPEPTPSIRESILQRCKAVMKGWISEDAEIEIVSEQVGLRPGRQGGVRVEAERVEIVRGDGSKERVHVVHHYGHAGAGYQNSVGSARQVANLVDEILKAS